VLESLRGKREQRDLAHLSQALKLGCGFMHALTRSPVKLVVPRRMVLRCQYIRGCSNAGTSLGPRAGVLPCRFERQLARIAALCAGKVRYIDVPRNAGRDWSINPFAKKT